MTTQPLEDFSKNLAEKFSIDDYIGIAETIISVIRKCREERNSTQEIKENISKGFLAKIRVRRELRRNIDQRVGIFKLNQIADEIVERGQEIIDTPQVEELIANADSL